MTNDLRPGLLLCLGLAAAATACSTPGTTPGGVGGRPASAPTAGPVCRRPPAQAPGPLTLVGYSDGPMSVRAAEAARTDALVRGLKQIAVKVGGEFVDVREEVNGEYSYRIRDRQTSEVRQVEVRGARPAGQPCIQQADGFVRAAVVVPEQEWRRLQIQSKGATLLVYRCKADPQGACDGAPLRAVQQVAAHLGLSLLSTPYRPPPDSPFPPPPARVRKLAFDYEAARLFVAELEAVFLGDEDGEFYSRGRASAWQVDGFEATFGPPIEVPGVKGGHYSKLAASKAALRKAYERLAEQVGARQPSY